MIKILFVWVANTTQTKAPLVAVDWAQAGRTSKQALLLCSLVFRAVFQAQPEQGLRSVLVQGLGESVECWRHLQPLVEHPPLPLQPHVLGPLDKAVQVPLGWRVAPDACNEEEP